jgi:hypothetical protein
MRWRRGRRRRNGAFGADAGEYGHAGWNPRRRNPTQQRTRTQQHHPGLIRSVSGQRSGVLLGQLVELVCDVEGETLSANPARLRGLFVAWMPGYQDLAIVRRAHGPVGRLSEATIGIHRQFHASAPRKASSWNWPERGGARPMGLIRTLTYVVPEWVESPEKRGFKWVHNFGDHGELGHGEIQGEVEYADTLKPMLLENRHGDLFIQRRPGNKYDVTKWIYW